jgi:hypothetical protein
MTPRKWMSDIFCAESKEVQHISIGHDSGGELRILLQKSSSPEGGICCFRLKTMSVTPYMMLVPPMANLTAGKYAARYSTSLNPKLNNELFVFERWNYCAGAAMLLHTILSLKQILITKKQGDIRNV